MFKWIATLILCVLLSMVSFAYAQGQAPSQAPEKPVQVEITRQQVNVILELLKRAQLRGEEVPAYNEVVAILTQAMTDEGGGKKKKK